MLKRMINHAVIDITIEPIDPMLIKSGQATVSGVDMTFVRTYRHGGDAEPFIPGSSLKGVIRSYAEKICRSLREQPVPVCLPYLKPGKEQNGEENQASCGLRITEHLNAHDLKSIPTPDVYRLSCPACRMFGSHYFIGRLATSDGYLTDTFRKSGKAIFENRDGVAIDRLTGGPVGSAKYDLEVLTRAEFGTRIEIRNFERWQLGLLSLVLRDMADGYIRIGMGKSRGLGRFRADVKKFTIHSFGGSMTHLQGLTSRCSAEENESYGFFQETSENPAMSEPAIAGLRYKYDLTESWKTMLETAVSDLTSYVTQVAWPEDIQTFMERGG